MSIYVTHLLNGLAFGFLISVIASGLALIFGFMRIVNFAHGAFYMLGAYIGFSLIGMTGSFWIALMVAPLVVVIIGFLFQKGILDRIPAGEELSYLLVTYGCALIIEDAVRIFWGTDSYAVNPPAVLHGTISYFGLPFPAYRLFLIISILGLWALLYLIFYRTRIGLQVRAETEDSEMAMALGIRSKLLSAGVFGLGMLLAGLAGVLVGPYLSLHHNMALDILVYAFIVVVVAGMRNFIGTLASGLLIGMILTIGNVFFPSFAVAAVYVVMILVLLIKPTGLFRLR